VNTVTEYKLYYQSRNISEISGIFMLHFAFIAGPFVYSNCLFLG